MERFSWRESGLEIMIMARFECLLREARQLSRGTLFLGTSMSGNHYHLHQPNSACFYDKKNPRNQKINLIDFSFKSIKATNQDRLPLIRRYEQIWVNVFVLGSQNLFNLRKREAAFC